MILKTLKIHMYVCAYIIYLIEYSDCQKTQKLVTKREGITAL